MIEYSRNVLGLEDAHSTEFNPKTKNPVVSLCVVLLHYVVLWYNLSIVNKKKLLCTCLGVVLWYTIVCLFVVYMSNNNSKMLKPISFNFWWINKSYNLILFFKLRFYVCLPKMLKPVSFKLWWIDVTIRFFMKLIFYICTNLNDKPFKGKMTATCFTQTLMENDEKHFLFKNHLNQI